TAGKGGYYRLRPLPTLTVVYRRRPIQDHARALERNESPADHFIQVGEDRLDRLLGLDHLDDEWEIERQAQHFLGMNHARGSEARHVAQHRERDRKSTRLNSSHQINSYAVFCLK